MKPKTKLGMPALLVLVLLLAVALTACTGSRLRGSSTGWSPAVAIPSAEGTGTFIDEGGTISPFDDTLTVTQSSVFLVGQVLQIDDEQMRVINIEGNDLRVDRGFNGTRAEGHADRTPIFVLGQRTTVIIVSKQGDFIALDDIGKPSTDLWTFTPPERRR